MKNDAPCIPKSNVLIRKGGEEGGLIQIVHPVGVVRKSSVYNTSGWA